MIELSGFPGGSDSKESAHNAGSPSLTPGSGRSPGGEHGNPPHYSCLENPMDRGAWWATVHRVPVLKTTEVTNIFPFIFTILEEETLNL